MNLFELKYFQLDLVDLVLYGFGKIQKQKKKLVIWFKLTKKKNIFSK